tara:strand:+ start:375 stop:599 length:225 start_codon:yes stop_codon:yes gene_type:complete
MSELRQLELTQKHIDSLNKFYSPKSSLSNVKSSTSPVDDLKIQFMGLKDQSAEVLQLYSDGIQKLKEKELHTKL